jgi:hypothetical protein
LHGDRGNRSCGGTFWYHSEWKDCQASVALDAAHAKEKLNAQKSLDASVTRQVEEKLAPVINDLRKRADDHRSHLQV